MTYQLQIMAQEPEVAVDLCVLMQTEVQLRTTPWQAMPTGQTSTPTASKHCR